MKFRNLLIGILLVGIFVNVGVVFGEDVVKPEWAYHLGDWASAISITPDGKYIVAGTGGYGGNGDYKVYLFNNKGNLQWSYKIDGKVESVAITPDGKYIVAGTWFDKNGNNHRDSEDYGKVYLFNKDGNLLWSRNLNPTVYDVSISSDGKYIVVAYSNKLSVFDTKGNLLWSYETYRWIYSISITPDGKYIVAGTGSTGDYGRVYLFD